MSTATPGTPPERRRRTGLPDVDALMDVRDAEHARLNEIITAAGAERVMAGARMAELVAAETRGLWCDQEARSP